ncbi:MAG: hypothetical protein H6680_05695 [Desulfobacteraceae bacterium]|nr:hypothetical protein [Desulfobacteraceae bacterium]
MFASDDLGKESDSGGGSSQVSQDDIDSMFASDDLGKESDSGAGSSQVSQDDIDSMFASDDLGKESDSGGGSSQVSQDDIDSLFDSETAQDSSEEKFSPDEFDDILKNSIPDLFDEDNDKPSERNVEKEPQDSKVPDFGDEEYDFSSVSQDAVDALLEGKSPKQGKADQGVNSDFSTELESGEISQADIEAILSEAKDLGVIDEEDADNDMDDVSATNDSDLAEMISQSEIDSLFGGASEISSENSEKPVEDVDLESEASDKAEDDFVPKDDWHLSQDEINGLLGSEDSENKSEKKDDEFIPKANGFEIEQDELDALLKSDSNDSDGKNTGDSGPEFEDGKGSNLISQEFLDYLEDEFLAQKEENDSDDLDVDDIFKDESSGDDILSDNEIDDLFGETSDDDVVADHAGDELDFISQDDIDELLGAVTEDESEEADDTYESFTESQEEPSEGVLSQEELDRLLNQQDDSPKEAANLDQAPVKEDHIPEKTVILEKEELAVEEEKGGGKKKKLIIFSIAASFIVLISAASVFFFISGKDAKAPVEIAEKTQDATDLITEPAADIPEQPFIEPAVISTVIFGELIVPAPLSSKKYSYLEVDVSVDIKGENNLVVFNKNNVFFRDVLFKTLDEEFKKISGKDDEKLERDQLESLLLKTLSNYFQENDVVKGLVFTRFEPV